MEQEEQQNHQRQKHKTGDHEHLDRNHESQQIANKDADTQAGKEAHHLTTEFPIPRSSSIARGPDCATRQSQRKWCGIPKACPAPAGTPARFSEPT